MPYSIVDKQHKRILLITVSEPFDYSTETAQIRADLHAILGDIAHTIYLIYDISQVSFSFSDLVSEMAAFAQSESDFEKQLLEHSRMILVGVSTLVMIVARTIAQVAPSKPTRAFETVEEALKHAEAELAAQH